MMMMMMMNVTDGRTDRHRAMALHREAIKHAIVQSVRTTTKIEDLQSQWDRPTIDAV